MVEKDEFIYVNSLISWPPRFKCLKEFAIILQIAASVLLVLIISTWLNIEGHYFYLYQSAVEAGVCG